MEDKPLFQSFFMGGFECSSHRLRSGKRLDLLASTQHDKYVVQDYRRLQEQGIYTARSGIRWHLVETKPYHYDFSSVYPMLKAAHDTGMQVIWDLYHYGCPDELDIFSPEFIYRFRSLAAAFTRLLINESDAVPFLSPINEISFVSWAGGDEGYLNPFAVDRGHELKKQLVRATIEGIEAIWQVAPQARVAIIEPAINIVAHPKRPQDRAEAEAYRLAQYQGWDMLTGRISPELGGQEKYLDIIGVNYYPINQWIHEGLTLRRSHPMYKPFRKMLAEVYERYQRPLFIAETGTEDRARPEWFNYVCGETRAAIQTGVPVEGICLYPILNHPGWDNDRHCCNGLWDYADENGEREIYEPLARELQYQQQLFRQAELEYLNFSYSNL